MTGEELKVSYHVIFPWLVFPCNTRMLHDEVGLMSELPQFHCSTAGGQQKRVAAPVEHRGGFGTCVPKARGRTTRNFERSRQAPDPRPYPTFDLARSFTGATGLAQLTRLRKLTEDARGHDQSLQSALHFLLQQVSLHRNPCRQLITYVVMLLNRTVTGGMPLV
jgi:hypothetical protein